jgi:TctA family transporter
LIVDTALEFQAPEFFSLMVLGLVAASTLSAGSPVKSIAMVVLGVILGSIGLDMYTATPRFDFGVIELYEGLSLAVIAMGIFGLTEIVTSVRSIDQASISGRPVTFRSMVPTGDDLRRSWGATFRGTAIGAFFGILPGTGATISSFMAYAVEKRVARDPSRFGKGAIEGVIAPEAANNAGDQTAFIPTMTLGIPGSATMALIIGAMIVHGIQPGPRLMIDKPDMFWGLIMSFWIGNVMLVLLNLPLIGIWIRVLRIPYDLLYPAIMMFVCIGAYSLNYSTFDVWMIVLFGAIGYFMRWLDFPAAPLILGFVLGPMMEQNLRRAMQLSRGSFMTFFERPISATIMVAAIAILAWTIWSSIAGRSRSSLAATVRED